MIRLNVVLLSWTAMLKQLALAGFAVCCMGHPQILSQKQACGKFSSAVVSIDAGGESRGTGFLVSSDGFILTASHVVSDETGYHPAIDITLSDGQHIFAKPAMPPTPESVGRDYALLKVEATKQLPFLTLGNTSEVETGADGTIIGFPFSALSANGSSVSTKFCVAASFAAVTKDVRRVNGTQTLKGGRIVPLNKDVNFDVIYFQGPSVKGLSGSPVIARDSGHVVGILSTKLTGIGSGLEVAREQIHTAGQHLRVRMLGVDANATLGEVIDTLDSQLANGLGSAVGIEDAAADLNRAKRQKR